MRHCGRRQAKARRRLDRRGAEAARVSRIRFRRRRDARRRRLARRRAEGKLRNLEARLAAEPLQGSIGIGHTRWATHGKPTETNAHPHASDRLAVVHNGIIENFRSLREELAAKGHRFATETDSEIAAFLVDRRARRPARRPAEAVHAALGRMRGAFALVYLFEGEDNLLIGARQGAPLAVGYGDGEMFSAPTRWRSPRSPTASPISKRATGSIATRTSVEFRDADNNGRAARASSTAPAGGLLAEKGNYRHFMAKEIHEQPEVDRPHRSPLTSTSARSS